MPGGVFLFCFRYWGKLPLLRANERLKSLYTYPISDPPVDVEVKIAWDEIAH